MIGFNNSGFAGKTDEELDDEETTLETLRKEQLYINEFSRWAQEQSDQISSITNKYNRLSDRIHILLTDYNNLLGYSFTFYSIVLLMAGYELKVFVDSMIPEGVISFLGKVLRHFLLGNLA